ncbi:LIM domain and actin-binding protein 1, partial [Orchesella cincta]
LSCKMASQHQSSMQSSFKSSSVSDTEGFTSMIESEKLTKPGFDACSSSASPDNLLIENLESDDDVECEEINRITNIEVHHGGDNLNLAKLSDQHGGGGGAVELEPSPEPNSEELGSNIQDEMGDDEVENGVEVQEDGVEFQEFNIEHVNMVSKTMIKSSSNSIQQQATATATVSSTRTSSIEQQSSTGERHVETATVESHESASAVNGTITEGTKKSSTKLERKTSKAGSKKNKSNAEISKENISVSAETKPTEEIAKKLGPGESRVFAKVCVANLRRSFGDLTVIDSVISASPKIELEFSGKSRSLDIPRPTRHPNPPPGPSSLPNYSLRKTAAATAAASSTKLQLFQPSYWETLLCSNVNKSSFSKFDSLAKNNEKNNQVQAIENNQESTEQESSCVSKPESKKMYCTSCEKQVFQMELIRAEKKDWHKNCFRCVTCRKVLSMDTYQSHEHKLYCKPHFKELFQPKAVVEEPQEERKKPKLQVIICESQPKELPPDVVRASDTPSTGLEDISIDVRSKFELFENFKESNDKQSAEPLPVKRSASVLAKLKKYENSLSNGNSELNGVSDEDLHGVEGIELQSDEEEEEEEEENSVIKSEINRKLKNPLQALNEIAHFKQMEQVRSKWEDGALTQSSASDSRKEELQKFRSRLCQGKSNQLKEMYEKALEGDTGNPTASRQEIEDLKSERARTFREMFEKGEIRKFDDDDEEEEEESDQVDRRGVDLEVFEAGVAKQSRSLFEKLDKRINEEQRTVVEPVKKRAGQFNKTMVAQFQNVPTSPVDVVRCLDKGDEPAKVNTAELSSKFKFFETYEDELQRKHQENKRDTLKRITSPREGIVKTEKDYEDDEDGAYRDPNVVRSSESAQDDTLQKSKTASKMLNIFRQMEENMSKGDAKDPIIRPMKQFTPPRDTAPRVYSNDSEEEEEEEEEAEEAEEEEEEEEDEENVTEQGSRDEFLKEVGSLARARSLRAKFERWEQQENERNKAIVQEELAESIESARNLKAKFEAMRLMEKENPTSRNSPQPLKVNRFVLNNNLIQRVSPDSFESYSGYHATSLPVSLNTENSSTNGSLSSSSNIMSSNEQCAMCEKRVYAMEKIEAGGKLYHKNCFRCSQCKSILRMDTFTSNKGTLFCTTHFKQLFKIKGNYDEGFGHETQYQVWAKKQSATQQN